MMDSIKAKDPSMALLSQDQLADLNTSLNTLFSQPGVVQPSTPSTHCLQPCYNNSPCLDSAYSRDSCMMSSVHNSNQSPHAFSADSSNLSYQSSQAEFPHIEIMSGPRMPNIRMLPMNDIGVMQERNYILMPPNPLYHPHGEAVAYHNCFLIPPNNTIIQCEIKAPAVKPSITPSLTSHEKPDAAKYSVLKEKTKISLADYRRKRFPNAPFATTYYASSDGTYYATSAADPNQHSAITAYATQADGTTVLPVTGQRAFRTVTAGEHSGLQQIVLAVGEAGSGSGSGATRQEIVAIPASLASQNVQCKEPDKPDAAKYSVLKEKKKISLADYRRKRFPNAPFATTYYASSDGTYYATSAADPNQHSAITAYATQADGTTVLPVTGQRAFRTVTAGEHSGLQQIVLAVGEAGSGSGSGATRQEIVAIPASLASQAIAGGAQVGEQPTFVAVQAGTSQDTQITDGPDGQPQAQLTTIVAAADNHSQSDSKAVHAIRMVLRQPDGTETEQTLPITSSRVPTVVTNDGQEVQLSDENQLQMISTIVEQAASGGLADGNNQLVAARNTHSSENSSDRIKDNPAPLSHATALDHRDLGDTCTERESIISSRKDLLHCLHRPVKHRDKHFHDDHGHAYCNI